MVGLSPQTFPPSWGMEVLEVLKVLKVLQGQPVADYHGRAAEVHAFADRVPEPLDRPEDIQD